MPRNIKFILIIALVGVTGAALFAHLRHQLKINQYDTAFASVSQGMDEVQVIRVMGTPDATVREGSYSFWDDAPLASEAKAQISREYRYTLRTFFLPITWTVGLDEHGHVVSKHRLD